MSNDKRDGFDNLQEQLKSAYRHCNQMSYKTRAAYYNHTEQFLKFYYEKFHGQKFVNVKGKHIRAYVEFMQEKGLAATTVMARLSGIRFSYDIAKGKHRLPDNSELGLEKRKIGKEDRAWLPQEIAGALVQAERLERVDAYYAVKLSSQFGLRIEEICTLRFGQIEGAMKYGELNIKGKGGQKRAVPIETEGQRELIKELYNFAMKNKLTSEDYLISKSVKDGVKDEIKALENWMKNHRDKFTDENRTEQAEEGKKPKKDTLTWHGLRYYYAQERYRRLTEANSKQPKRKTSESLGHHRPDITNLYLSEIPGKH